MPAEEIAANYVARVAEVQGSAPPILGPPSSIPSDTSWPPSYPIQAFVMVPPTASPFNAPENALIKWRAKETTVARPRSLRLDCQTFSGSFQ
jgi:hypothetical protein